MAAQTTTCAKCGRKLRAMQTVIIVAACTGYHDPDDTYNPHVDQIAEVLHKLYEAEDHSLVVGAFHPRCWNKVVPWKQE